MDEEEIIAKGNWCLICECLEDEEDIVDGRCIACGCDAGSHQSVKVVAVDASA